MQLHASALGVGAGTAQPLIPAPGAGFRITILGIVVSVGATAATIVSLIDSLKAANTKQWNFALNQHAEPSPLRLGAIEQRGLAVHHECGRSDFDSGRLHHRSDRWNWELISSEGR
jgi:hypothetical protein